MLFYKVWLLMKAFLLYPWVLCLLLHTKVNAWDLMSPVSPTPECKKFGPKCSGNDHTVCRFQGIGPECKNAGEGGVTEAEKKEIVDKHNELRGLVASGNETRGAPGPQPSASNMLKMSWDDDLALVAQRWADQCTFAHDTCREDTRGAAGQNIYWRYRYPSHEVNWTHAIQAWYDEVDLFNSSIVPSYSFNPKTGHYTQVVWANTFLVGCGRRDYGRRKSSSTPNPSESENQTEKIYVCNYYPSGNWIGEPVYINGTTCGNCPNGTRCNGSLCESDFLSPRNTTPTLLSSSTSKPTPKQVTTQQTTRNKTNNTSKINTQKSKSTSLHTTEHTEKTAMNETSDDTHPSTASSINTSTTTTSTNAPTTDYITSTTQDITRTTTESIYSLLWKLLRIYGFTAYKVYYI